MSRPDRITPRQLTAAAFVSVLSPLVRRCPRMLAETAGRTAWLAPLMCVLPLTAEILVLWLLYRRQAPGTGYADLLTGTLGRLPGRALCGLYGLWFLFYAGFLLRSGADRFISTVYPGAEPGLFVLGTAALCLTAALGRTVSLARSAMLFRPLMAALFGAVFLLSLKDLEPALLLPVTGAELLPNLRGALELGNLLSAAGFLVFFTDRLTEPFRARDWLGWAAAAVLLIFSMTVSCLGVFGPALTARMSYPFFMLVRDLSVLGALERAEPVVIALWVLSDFVMISLLLQAAETALRSCVGQESGSRGTAALCAGLSAVAALAMPEDLTAAALISDTLIPAVNAVFALALPLPVLIFGALRKKL